MLQIFARRIPAIFLSASCLFAAVSAAAHAIIIASSPGVDAVIIRPDRPVDGAPARAASWVWPLAFIVVGFSLLIYREA